MLTRITKFLILISYLPTIIIAQPNSTIMIDNAFNFDIGELDIVKGIANDEYGNIYCFGEAGIYNQQLNTNYFIIKFTPQGTIDSSFSLNGILETDFADFDISELKSVVYYNDHLFLFGNGKYLANDSTSKLVIQKIDLAGNLDINFSTNGQFVFCYLGNKSYAGQLQLTQNEKLLLSATSLDSSFIHKETTIISRLNLDGTYDTTFGGTGSIQWDYYNGTSPTFKTPPHSFGSNTNGIIETPWNNYLCYGYYNSGFYNQNLLLSINKDGSLNPSFGEQGFYTSDFISSTNNEFIGATTIEHAVALITKASDLEDYALISVNALGDATKYEEIDIFDKLNKANSIAYSNKELMVTGFINGSRNTSPISEFFTATILDKEFNSLINVVDSNFNGDGAECTATLHIDSLLFLAGSIFYSDSNNYSDVRISMAKYKAKEVTTEIAQRDKNNEVKLFPNPISTTLNIATNGEVLPIKITDLSGRIIKKITCSNVCEIDVIDLPPGIYIANYFSNDKSVTSKLMKY